MVVWLYVAMDNVLVFQHKEGMCRAVFVSSEIINTERGAMENICTANGGFYWSLDSKHCAVFRMSLSRIASESWYREARNNMWIVMTITLLSNTQKVFINFVCD